VARSPQRDRLITAFAARCVALGVYIVVALMWLVPDRRVERHLTATAAQSQEET
jgi:hypothetical protein